MVASNSAAAPVLVDELRGKINLDSRIELLEDTNGVLSFKDILNPSVAARFFTLQNESPNFGFTKSVWWVRLTLENRSADSQVSILRQNYPLIDYLTFWEQRADGLWREVATGDRLPFASRDIAQPDFLFKTTVPAQSTRTYYLRFQSDGPINIGLSLLNSADAVSSVGTEQLGFGIYFGGFIVLLFYNLFIFVAVRDKVFFYYLLYLASYGAYFAVHNGLAFQYFWPATPWWANTSLVVLLASTLFWGVKFSRSILNSSRHSPLLDKVAIVLQWIAAVGLIVAFLLPYSIIILPLAILSAVVPPLLFWLGINALLAGESSARYFLLAWTMLLIGVIAYMGKTFGVLPHNFITQNGFQIGSLVEMVLLSLALAKRVADLQRDSVTDSLTGLFNRRSFDERLDHEFERSVRYSQPLSLLMVDADHFKTYNDTHGHRHGDAALCAIADELETTARSTDQVCRYGGEEFVIIMPATSSYEAAAVGERLRKNIKSLKLARGSMTISIGIATLTEGTYQTQTELIEAADHALYEAKDSGRNRVFVQQPPGTKSKASSLSGAA